MSYNAWLFLHILLLVAWLGTDVGVLVGGWASKNKNLSTETREKILGIGMQLDMFPRTAMTLMLPTGMHLALSIGVLNFSSTTVTLVWLFSLAWLAITWIRYLNEGKPIGMHMAKVAILIDIIVLGVCGWIAISSFGGNGPIIADWVATKVLLFGLIALTVIVLEFVFLPGVIAFVGIINEGSTPEREATYSKSMNEKAAKIRKELAPAHLAYVETILEKIEVAGPLSNAAGEEYTSSAFIYKTETSNEAESLLHADPYYLAGLYATVTIKHFYAAAGNWAGGKTW